MSKLRKLFSNSKEVDVKPSEPAKVKSSAEIRQEYTDVCARIGNARYQIFVLEQDVDLLLDQARNLNQEGAKAIQREALEASAKKEKSQMSKKVTHALLFDSFYIPSEGTMKATLPPDNRTLKNLDMSLEDNGTLVLTWLSKEGYKREFVLGVSMLKTANIQPEKLPD